MRRFSPDLHLEQHLLGDVASDALLSPVSAVATCAHVILAHDATRACPQCRHRSINARIDVVFLTLGLFER